jgi:hypothetical protein
VDDKGPSPLRCSFLASVHPSADDAAHALLLVASLSQTLIFNVQKEKRIQQDTKKSARTQIHGFSIEPTMKLKMLIGFDNE